MPTRRSRSGFRTCLLPNIICFLSSLYTVFIWAHCEDFSGRWKELYKAVTCLQNRMSLVIFSLLRHFTGLKVIYGIVCLCVTFK